MESYLLANLLRVFSKPKPVIVHIYTSNTVDAAVLRRELTRFARLTG